MREYLTTVLLVSAVTAILGVLPSEERIRKTVAFAMSLCVLSAVVLPLPALLSDVRLEYSSILDSLEGETLKGSEWLEEETLATVATGLSEHLCERYGVAEGELSVAVDGDLIDGTVILHRITLSLSGRAQMADAIGMKKYIEENTGAECEVIYLEK